MQPTTEKARLLTQKIADIVTNLLQSKSLIVCVNIECNNYNMSFDSAMAIPDKLTNIRHSGL